MPTPTRDDHPERARGSGRPRAAGRLPLAAVVAAAAVTASAVAQEVHWKSDAVFYGDNTEFFTPYRVGETILGTWITSSLLVTTGPRTEVSGGVYANLRSGEGGDNVVKPTFTFRYHTDTTQWILGAMEPVNRHGYLEPLEVTTLELTRPVEYGFEWIETRRGFSADAYLDWQHLNTPNSREIFDYGVLVRGDLAGWLSVEVQQHGLHHGGQLYDVGPVTNNDVAAIGARVHGELPVAGESSFAAFRLTSSGKADPSGVGPTIRGNGTYLRGSIAPAGFVEVFGIWWKGRDFISAEGDHNYGSVGSDPGLYRQDRSYQELGVAWRKTIESHVNVDLEARLHRIDGKVEYSYRFVARVPLDFRIH